MNTKNIIILAIVCYILYQLIFKKKEKFELTIEQQSQLLDMTNLPKFYLKNPQTDLCIIPKSDTIIAPEGEVLSYGTDCSELTSLFTMDEKGILKHISGKCVANINPDLPLQLVSDICDQPFQFLTNGSLRHVPSGKCVQPETGYPGEDIRLVLSDKCVGTEDYIKFIPIGVSHEEALRETNSL